MGRPAKFDRDEMLDAAVALIARHGASGLTVASLAKHTKSSTGSIYHRFPSMDLLVAEVWVRAVDRFQVGFVAALDPAREDDTIEAAIEAALHTPRWCRTNLDEARVLLLHRHRDLVTAFPHSFGERLSRSRQESVKALRSFVRLHFGRITRRALQTAAFVLVDVPYGAVRRHLAAGEAPPLRVDEMIAETCRAVLARDP